MAEHEPLTVRGTLHLAKICEAAIGTKKVVWLTSTGDVAEGTARSIGDERGNFLREDEDIRDGFLRITSTSGWEIFEPVSRLADLVRQGGFGISD